MTEKQNTTVPKGQVAIRKMVLAALLLALGLVLPFVTGQIPEVGNMLLPMHLPVLICGLVCGWKWGAVVGFVLPLMRSFLFQMPPLLPTMRTGGALCMAFELMTYGLVAGLLYGWLKKYRWGLIVSLLGAMLAGRIVWALASMVIYRLFADFPFTFQLFLAGGFLSAWPGMILQIVLVPLLVRLLEKTRLIPA
ncbi:MAG: ECF transporter S component [Clostridia bacterium]|nr:ECF transporter S component [Clostridia bacterium]MBP3649229.1 ECF transporter S component [Clostridia bacterium]